MGMTAAEKARRDAADDAALLDGLVRLLWRLRAHTRGESPIAPPAEAGAA